VCTESTAQCQTARKTDLQGVDGLLIQSQMNIVDLIGTRQILDIFFLT